ncbi:MAG: DUF6144 family protein [candidate division Zixibacteria bacterium]|nr:DUF6144 family protein [candidate division Zixibacteria bacterium]
MDRKNFLRRFFKSGISMFCCGAMLGKSLLAQEGSGPSGNDQAAQDWIKHLEKRMIKGAETPAWRKAEESSNWIKWMVDNMDAMLDQDTRIKLLQACGRSCYINAFGVAGEEKPTPEAAEQYIKRIESAGYEVQRKDNLTYVYFNWGRNHQNPQGLMMQDGYCMCPIVETVLPGLSPSYCNCSTGYVKEIFERQVGRQVKVDILESIQRGGKDCRFKIEIPKA